LSESGRLRAAVFVEARYFHLNHLHRGYFVTEGHDDFFFIKNDTSIISKPDSSKGHFTGNVHVRVDGSMLEVMLREIENLKEFPHGCNEQLTTKLLAIYYEEAIKKMLGREDFNNTDTKKRILDQLVGNQHPDGWLSYIIRRGQNYLNAHLPEMSITDQLTTLRTLSDGKFKTDYKSLLENLDTLKNFSVNDRMLLVKVRKQQGLPYRAALDSEAGERITLRTTVVVKKESEYIMIEVPIPAGCMQVNKTSYYRYPEVARENFKDQTDIFCDRLYPGTYTFDITLEARFK
jgi:hypothetical protein